MMGRQGHGPRKHGTNLAWPASHRARAWAAMSARGLAQVRHDFWVDTMWPGNSPLLDEYQ